MGLCTTGRRQTRVVPDEVRAASPGEAPPSEPCLYDLRETSEHTVLVTVPASDDRQNDAASSRPAALVADRADGYISVKSTASAMKLVSVGHESKQRHTMAYGCLGAAKLLAGAFGQWRA